MTGEARMPTWKERENNKRRERRRRAVAARIFTGLRLNGNYKLSKHSNNNDVLKALCHEAGWTVEPDGTTYRKGSRPVENMDMMGTSVSASASPHTSYNPNPVSSSYAPSIITDGNSLIPWLRNLSSSSSSTTSSSSSSFMHHYMCGGSISAPVTPPMSSPTAGTPRVEKSFYRPGWGPHPFLPLSTPPSPGRQKILPDFAFPTSQNFSLVSSNPFFFGVENLTSGSGGSLMCTPGQSGTCSPAVAEQTADIPMARVIPNEFAFGSNMMGFVKPWAGEMIHEECGEEDLELTLGGSKAR